MTFQETVEQTKNNPELWARPVAWRGTGQAYSFAGSHPQVVPSLHFKGSMIPTKLFGVEWEVCTPDEVLGEDSYLSLWVFLG